MHPKRLIEVDLPIKRISAHARREKSIRHGHISTLHIWWARRPLGACRAVICASLWPDPADKNCPKLFRDRAQIAMRSWASKHLDKVSPESFSRFVSLQKNPEQLNDSVELRSALLDFIADFANWDNSTVQEYLDVSQELTLAAHIALGGTTGTLPLVIDPFAGGGSIPLESLRVGASTFASDINPVAVLLNKVVLEYVPKYREKLVEEVRKQGEWIKSEATRKLKQFYPKDEDAATPIAYIWARTIKCEGPGCGTEIPLLRSLWLSKKKRNVHALRLVPNRLKKLISVEIVSNPALGESRNGTMARGSATCPCCGYTTPATSVKRQLQANRGGTANARLLSVVTTKASESGRFFRLPTPKDISSVHEAELALNKLLKSHKGSLSLVPNEAVNPLPHSVNRLPLYGMTSWGDAFMPRQALTLVTLNDLVKQARSRIGAGGDPMFAVAVESILALAVSRLTDISNALCPWSSGMQQVVHLFGRQAVPMTWDYAETSPLSGASGDFSTTIGNMLRILERESAIRHGGHAERASATAIPLPDASAQLFVTDPPYYDAISYADLSDFFYVWLRRALNESYPDLFEFNETPKPDEIIVEPTPVAGVGKKNQTFYLDNMKRAMSDARRVLMPEGVGIIVFAHKSTAGWEAQLQGMLDAGLTITASWPIDTEREDKVSGIGQARLGSSIHLVCRPRETATDLTAHGNIGDWRDVLQELPVRIHEWMPRLAEEGVVGADAIFACLGPALEIYSRYMRVEKANGDLVTLKEYLEHVWSAVAKEALTIIIPDADTSGFEEDARLTAMWLWTVTAASRTEGEEKNGTELDEQDESVAKKSKMKGFALEYDAARKIAQGLGANLEEMSTLVEISGEQARLLSVSERSVTLFKKGGIAIAENSKKSDSQSDLFTDSTEENEISTARGIRPVINIGETVLDRIHQGMILFATGRIDALKGFLVEEGVGSDQRFWRLAQALSALYPSQTDEKRWIDGVLARKKGFRF